MQVFAWFTAVCRAAIRVLITRRTRVGVLEKFLRGVLVVPIFGALWILLRIRGKFSRPLRVQADTPDGMRFTCVLPDLIQTYIYLFGVWEPDLTSFVRSRLQPGDTFIDVGANIGYDTLLASRAVAASGMVVAIEASPAVFARLMESIRLNGSPTNVRAINKAVSSIPGMVHVFAGPEHNIGLTTTVQRGRMNRVAEVEALPLGAVLANEERQRIRMIKIDVEGAEEQVLAGMVEMIDSLADAAEIAVELSPLWWRDRSKTAQQVLRPFVDAGYHVYTIPNNYWPWRYLWPNDVQRPRRLREERALITPMKRLDVVLSRIDADYL